MRLVVLGTDTGVGKTRVGCALVRALRERGVDVAVSKPVESGADSGDGVLRPADAIALADAAGSASIDTVCPWPLPRPVTPAEELEAHAPDVTLADVADAAARATAGSRLGLVETAGGVHSPLVGTHGSLALAAALDAPAVLVTRDRLGTLSVTSTAIDAIRATGVELVGCILNRWVDDPGDDVSLRTNAEWLARMHPDVPVFCVRGDAPDALVSVLIARASRPDGSARTGR